MRRLSTTPRLTRVYVSSKSDLNSPSYVDFSAGSGMDWDQVPSAKTRAGALRHACMDVKSDSPTSPGSPREAQPPVSGISNKHLQGLPGAFLTPKRPPKRCENATVRSQVSNLIFTPPREAPGKLNPPFRGSQTSIFKASRGLF